MVALHIRQYYGIKHPCLVIHSLFAAIDLGSDKNDDNEAEAKKSTPYSRIAPGILDSAPVES